MHKFLSPTENMKFFNIGIYIIFLGNPNFWAILNGVRPGPASANGRASAYKSSKLSSTQMEAFLARYKFIF